MAGTERIFDEIAAKPVLVAAAAGLICMASQASAGGFGIREQSVSSQGAAYAGSAAGGDLSSMFWNPAALAASRGTNSESHFTVFVAESTLTATDGFGGPVDLFGTGSERSSGNIAIDALIPSSYFGYQVTNRLWFGLATNSPFGLVTKPENINFDGAPLARRSSIFTLNVNPAAAYEIMPGVAIGAGVQVQYMDATFKFATSIPATATSAVFEGDDIGAGATAGVYLTPAEGTQIGVGWRSQITHELNGDFQIAGSPLSPVRSRATLTTPDIVTVSIRQSVSPSLRLMGTFEWTNWSDFDAARLTGTTGGFAQNLSIDANWDDAWFASIGFEYDVSDALTVRSGIAYEESPVQSPVQRLTAVPDSDRLWLSLGGTYRFSEYTTVDLAYTHVFVQDAMFSRTSVVSPAIGLNGRAETDVNLFSIALKSKLDENHPVFGAFFR